MLKALFFGVPQLSFGTESADASLSGRVQALFAYLCVTRQPQSRSKLADLLWDDRTDQEAKGNLRYVIRDLRKVIDDYLLVDSQMVAFNFDLPHWFDITSFTTYLAPNMRAGTPTTEPEILQELLNLYTGDFLSGFHIQDAPNFEQWVFSQRRFFHDAMVYGLQLSAQHHSEIGDYEAGLALNQYLLTLEPWREEAHRQRMLMFAASGQRSAALMQYELCCQILDEELDVPPMNETTSLYTQIKSGVWFIEQHKVEQFNQQRVAVRSYPQMPKRDNMSGAAPAEVRTVSSTVASRADLGAMSVPGYMIGRCKELAALQRWIVDDASPLVAILGLGGQGKSALAAWFVQTQVQTVTPLPADSEYVKDWPLTKANGQPPTEDSRLGGAHMIWRSLEQSPPCIEILQDWVRQLSSIPTAELPTNFDQLVSLLFSALEQQRALFVLDGVEAVLRRDRRETQKEADLYERLFRLFIERQHRGCLLLTSRIRPMALTYQQKSRQRIHCLDLDGLTYEENEDFLAAHGLQADSNSHEKLHLLYAGNPGLLGQVADLIHDLFDGDVAAFLQEEIYFLDEIGATLAEQFAHLPPLELQVMQVLLEAQEPLSPQIVRNNLPQPIAKQGFYNVLRDLQRAHLVQKVDGRFRLAPLPMSYLIDRVRAKDLP